MEDERTGDKVNEAAKELSKLGASKGGQARALSLTPEERKEIARRAIEARWEKAGKEKIPRATHRGEIHIGDSILPCAVLEDGTRVLTQEGFLKAIGRSPRPAGGRSSSVEKIAPFLDLDNLKPFINEELICSTKPIQFRALSGGTGGKAYGYNAEILPKVCEVYLRARDAGVLSQPQQKFAIACDILMRGLAHVGIIALVDEATGYQEVRDKLALQKILEMYIAKELRPWVRTFPNEFYEHIFRLKGWTYNPLSGKRPKIVGKITNDLIYDRLAPGLLDELKDRTPRDEKGRTKNRYFQWLTDDLGHPKLMEHFTSVITLFKATTTWGGFYKLIERALPRYGRTLSLPYLEGERNQEEEEEI